MVADAGTLTDARAFSQTTIRFDQLEKGSAFLSYIFSSGGTFFPLKVLDDLRKPRLYLTNLLELRLNQWTDKSRTLRNNLLRDYLKEAH